MVVIAIVAVLAAASMPVYKTYRIKVNVTNAYNLLKNLQSQILIEYNTTGTLQSSPKFNGVSLAPNSSVTINAYGIKTLNYRRIPTETGGSSTGVAFIAVLDSSFSGYCVSGNCNLRIATVLDSNQVMKTYCGKWSPTDSNDLTSEVLPVNCNCTNYANTWIAGVIGGGGGTNGC